MALIDCPQHDAIDAGCSLYANVWLCGTKPCKIMRPRSTGQALKDLITELDKVVADQTDQELLRECNEDEIIKVEDIIRQQVSKFKKDSNGV